MDYIHAKCKFMEILQSDTCLCVPWSSSTDSPSKKESRMDGPFSAWNLCVPQEQSNHSTTTANCRRGQDNIWQQVQ